MLRSITFCFLLLSLSIVAQPSQDWYTKNDRGRHYEGSYTRKVSNPSINLVALSTPLPAYTFGQRQRLQVKFFSPESGRYNLHAEELRIAQFYWMEDKNRAAKKGWNSFDDWQVDYLLRRLSIDHRNLGLLIQIGNRNDRQFVPARMQIAGEEGPAGMYVAQIRLGRPAGGGSYALFKGRSKSTDHRLLQRKVSRKSSGTVFPLIIPINELQEHSGWFTVEVNLREERTGDPFTYSFSFYHSH